MTHFALDEDYLLLQNQPPARAKISAFARLQGTHPLTMPRNASSHVILRLAKISLDRRQASVSGVSEQALLMNHRNIHGLAGTMAERARLAFA